MNKKLFKKKCVVCHGSGYVLRKPRQRTISDEQRKEILKLYRKGLSYREICKATGVKHPYSVQYAVLTANKTNP